MTIGVGGGETVKEWGGGGCEVEQEESKIDTLTFIILR